MRLTESIFNFFDDTLTDIEHKLVKSVNRIKQIKLASADNILECIEFLRDDLHSIDDTLRELKKSVSTIIEQLNLVPKEEIQNDDAFN